MESVFKMENSACIIQFEIHICDLIAATRNKFQLVIKTAHYYQPERKVCNLIFGYLNNNVIEIYFSIHFKLDVNG